MYCSRRGREVPRPTDTCARCGRCNWEQKKDTAGSSRLAPTLFLAAAALLTTVLLLMR